MKKSQVFRLAAVAAVIAGAQSAALATNGYFSHGYGMKSKGMGGAAVAMTDNAFAGANNPAAAAWAGNRMEVGLDLFMPTPRGVVRSGATGNGAGLNGAVESDQNLFYVPEFAYNRAVNDKMGVGVSVYGNGGLNTDYAGGQAGCADTSTNPPTPFMGNMICGMGRLGIDMMQLIVAPTVGYKLNAAHSIGVSPLLVHQQFKADGLQSFAQMSQTPGSVTGQGYDSSNGFGVRLGYLGKVSDQVSVGASYSPKIAMSKLSKYKGLFADDGNFDIPENYTLGLAVKASPSVMVALDYQRINYANVPSVGNLSSNQSPLGAATGPGFGWKNIDVWKLGVQWQANPKLVMRAGVNVGGNPVEKTDVTFNILAPGVITTHYTIGGTYELSKSTELTLSYMNAPKVSVTGPSMFNSPNLLPPGGLGGNETISMGQQSLGIQFGLRF